jgi:MFS family permease
MSDASGSFRVPARSGWWRVAFAMFAVGWGANQFSPMLIVYRQDLGLTAGALAGLFGVYAAALIPGLLIGGPASDRFGRRPVVIPFVALSPLATLLLVLGPRSLPLIVAGRALAGICSGVVFGAATAWVQELSPDPGVSARRSAVALSAGFGLGPFTAAMIAEWVPDPLLAAYLPHLVLGAAALAALLPAPETGGRAAEPGQAAAPARRWPPGAVRAREFWLAVAPAAPWVFGCAALALVVLPEQATSTGRPSVGFAGVITILTLGSGVAVQPLARRLEGRRRLAGNAVGLACAAAAALLGAGVAVSASRSLALAAAVLFGLGYGLCLVSGLRGTEHLAGPQEHGAAVACYYVLTYLGFGFPYLADGLDLLAGRAQAFVILAAAAAALAAWAGACAVRLGRVTSQRAPEPGGTGEPRPVSPARRG